MKHPVKYILYRRISTSKQKESGLGLDAQMNEINLFLAANSDYEIVEDLIETASGKDHLNRPVMLRAMELASKTGSTILVNRLDRISRDLEFVASLMKNPKVNFKVATQPNADNFTLAIYSAIAMKEREMISIRTRNALQSLKRSGKRLGVEGKNNIKRVNEIRKERANNYSDKVIPLIKPLLNEGHSYRQIASILNGSGVKSPQGKQIRPDLVFRMVQKIK